MLLGGFFSKIFGFLPVPGDGLSLTSGVLSVFLSYTISHGLCIPSGGFRVRQVGFLIHAGS